MSWVQQARFAVPVCLPSHLASGPIDTKRVSLIFEATKPSANLKAACIAVNCMHTVVVRL